MAKRRNFSAAFKANIALEALRGDRTLAELAGRHKVHPNLITKWKRPGGGGDGRGLLGQAGRLGGLARSGGQGASRQIGELTIAKDFLSKAFGG